MASVIKAETSKFNIVDGQSFALARSRKQKDVLLVIADTAVKIRRGVGEIEEAEATGQLTGNIAVIPIEVGRRCSIIAIDAPNRSYYLEHVSTEKGKITVNVFDMSDSVREAHINEVPTLDAAVRQLRGRGT